MISEREARRGDIFSTAQSSREIVFLRAQSQREKRSEWFVQQRDRIYEDGKIQRAKVTDKLVGVISKAFDSLVSAEEASFTEDQQVYAFQVKEYVTRVRIAFESDVL